MTESRLITVQRGNPTHGVLSLDMSKVYEVEQRITETRTVNPMTAPELRSVFNEACSLATKYIAWVKYEILNAKKNLDLVRAEILLDKLPSILKDLKDQGIKDSADIRDSIVKRDTEYQTALDVLNTLEATKQLLDSKAKTFERAYWDCRDLAKDKGRIANSVNLSVAENELGNRTDLVIGKSKI